MSLSIAIETDGDWDSSSASWDAIADPALRAAIAESAYPHLADASREVEVSLAFTTDEEVHALNRQWRGKDKPTNVLSFPMADADALAATDGPPLLLGDIALAHGVCSREAEEKQIALERHATHLVVHGMLHLLGYDHQDDPSAEDMEARETRALSRLGHPDPYGEDD
ncbi:rRNA maturation RNase YbeY [Sphingomicrobium sp. XHP0239]|uniref:rRNA maturation RNase YbeY n=1 Tax=Sphingomicrobium maritimum TaxID=3133972 RepID=UPI0031CCB097